ncbi:MAG: DNA polymerase beta [Cryomorphaceae bacterium]|nr:MAG: DNA polymerase beta [Cryomorphaceae bacterium]
MITQRQKQAIKDVLSAYKPIMIGLFGSYARGEQNSKSDLDLLVDFDDNVNLLDIIGMEQELSARLGIKVDLVTRRSLHPRLKEYVERDLIILKQ